MVDAEDVTGLIQGQQMEHAATVVPSVKRSSVLPIGNCAKIVTTRIQGISEATVVSVVTMSATEATVVANRHAEKFMKYKLMISFRTSFKNEAVTTAMMFLLMTQSLIGWYLNKATQLMQSLLCMMYPLLPGLIIVQNCT